MPQRVTQAKVLALLRERGPLAPAELALGLGVGKDGMDTVLAVLERLEERGKIEWDGN